MPPRVIGQYQILAVLGTGGIGSVYRALDKRTNDEVALKLLSSGPALDPIAARRMAREFEALADLSHPNVVRVYDTGVYRGYPFLVMELIEGLTLREFLMVDHTGGPAMMSGRRAAPSAKVNFEGFDEMSVDSGEAGAIVPFDLERLAAEPESNPGLFAGEHVSGHGPEALRKLANIIDEPMTDERSLEGPVARALAVTEKEMPRIRDPNLVELNRPERIGLLKDALLQVCDALAYIHARGMVHRDLKPTNIMVDEDRRVKLMDFGLAKFLAEDTAVTAAGRIVGTYRYMAPEQLLGERLDGRSDLYALGVMLYELLAGRPPFDAKNPLEMCRLVLEQEAVPLQALNPDADETLTRIAHRLMHKDPSERYQTAEEVYEVVFE